MCTPAGTTSRDSERPLYLFCVRVLSLQSVTPAAIGAPFRIFTSKQFSPVSLSVRDTSEPQHLPCPP